MAVLRMAIPAQYHLCADSSSGKTCLGLFFFVGRGQEAPFLTAALFAGVRHTHLKKERFLSALKNKQPICHNILRNTTAVEGARRTVIIRCSISTFLQEKLVKLLIKRSQNFPYNDSISLLNNHAS